MAAARQTTTRGSRTAQGERSRERLLEAAISLMAERGYSATSVGDVCKRAGVAKTALYWHFESKEGLLSAVIERVGLTWIEEVKKSVYVEGTPVQRLDRLIDDWRRILAEQSHLLRVQLLVLLESDAATAKVRETLQSVWKRAEDAIVEGLEDTVPAPVPDLDLVAHTMLTLMQGIMMQKMLDPEFANEERLFQEFRRTVLFVVNARLPVDLQLPPDVLLG